MRYERSRHSLEICTQTGSLDIQSVSAETKPVWTILASFVVVMALAAVTLSAPASAADTLDRIKQSGKLELGYRLDAEPFSFRDSNNNAAGYSVALCQKIAEQVKAELGLGNLTVDWVPVSADDQIRAVKDGKVDLVCGGAVDSIERRHDVAFSIPVAAGGVGALVRADADIAFKETLLGQKAPGPFWRGNPFQVLSNRSFAVLAKSPTETWLNGRVDYFKLPAKVVPVESYDAGIDSVLNRKTDVFFAERPILMGAMRRSPAIASLLVLERQYTVEPLAMILARNNDDFRLVVDKALSHFYADDAFKTLYAQWFGDFNEEAATFFRFQMLKE